METSFSLSEAQREFQALARRVADEYLRPLAVEYERTGTQLPKEVVKGLGERGMLGLDIPESYGGKGLDTLSVGVVLEQIAHGWFAATGYCAALGAAPILHAGTEDVKQRYLPGVADGSLTVAFALSEAGAGTDAGQLQLRARPDGDGYVLNGSKIYITNASVADLFVIFARTGEKDSGSRGVSVFAVEAGTPGLSVGQRFETLGHRCSQIWEVNLDDCRVPAEALIGPEGEGFKYVREGFSRNRALYACRVLGVAQAALDYAIEYVSERETFGLPIGSRDSVRMRCARMAMDLEAARQLSYAAAAAQDDPDRSANDRNHIASMAKAVSADVCERITREAVQLLGGAGYTADHPVERYFRDSKLFTIGDGSSEIMEHVVARSLFRVPAH